MKERLIPGAMLCPYRAASIGIVPDPQTGSTNGLSGNQWASITRAAAMFSLSGAPPLFFR